MNRLSIAMALGAVATTLALGAAHAAQPPAPALSQASTQALPPSAADAPVAPTRYASPLAYRAEHEPAQSPAATWAESNATVAGQGMHGMAHAGHEMPQAPAAPAGGAPHGGHGQHQGAHGQPQGAPHQGVHGQPQAEPHAHGQPQAPAQPEAHDHAHHGHQEKQR